MKKSSLVNSKREEYFIMIGFRLKEERERLGLTQQEISDKISISKRTFIDWEKGKTYPTALQLAALNAIGVDITYIVNGQYSQAAIEPEEKVLLNAYRQLPDKSKKDILLSILAGEDIKKIKNKKDPLVKIKGENNTVSTVKVNKKMKGDLNIGNILKGKP